MMRSIWMWLACAATLTAGNLRPVALRVMRYDISPPLREMAARANGTLSAVTMPPVKPDASDPVLGINFPGIAADVDPNGTPPPDTNGAVGATQFVQWVSNVFAVFRKTDGAILLGPANGNTIWSGFGGPCEEFNSGQPIAQYDKRAGRWVLAQPVLVPPYTYCIAVSTSTDATGTFRRYAFQLTVPPGAKPDSPKLAVWPDGYYTSLNLIQGGQVTGAMVVAYDRVNMLIGPSRPAVSFTLPQTDSYMLPADWDGASAPTAGEPEYYMRVASLSTMSLFKFHVDFNSPANSTFTGPVTIHVTPPPAAVDPDLCTRKPGHCYSVSQPPPGSALDALPNQLMYRLIWRRLHNKEHLLANQTLMSNEAAAGPSSLASVYWYDIINPNTSPTRVQQGSVGSPSVNFWMGSLAEDKDGNLALGFSASGATLFPSVAFAGRLATDPAGTTGPPQLIAPGSNVQTNTGLWGAYSSMSMDPSDDCTFWYTTEFIQNPPAGASPNWSTWIAALKFPNCQ